MADDDMDDLLEGLEGEARESRVKLLRALRDDGVPEDELRQAVAEDRLVLLPADRELSGDTRMSRSELAEKTGLTVEQLRQARGSLGLPVAGDDDALYGEEDIAPLVVMRELLEAGVSMDAVIDLNRVIGRATNQIAAASRQTVGEALIYSGGTEYEAAIAVTTAARELVPKMRDVLAYAYAGHLRELLRSDVVSAADIAAGRTPGAREMTVAFADLVGFTRLGEQVEAEEVGDVVGKLESITGDVVEKPVTFVKTIGDAVMLVAPAADPLIETGLRLIEAIEDEDDLQLRVGIACGPALERAGDWYGSPVNQASRVTAVARPGSVLATESVKRHAEGDWTWSFARERKLKGVGEVKLHRARRPKEG